MKFSKWTYWRSCVVKSSHCNFEASSLSNQDILLWYPHILKSDSPGVRAPLAHVHFLPTQQKQMLALSSIVIMSPLTPKCFAVVTFLPIWIPGVSASTIKPVKALAVEHLGSALVRARRKYLKHWRGKKKKKSHKQTTRGQINKNHNSCLKIQFNVVLLCLTRLNSLQGSVLVREHWIRTGYEQI